MWQRMTDRVARHIMRAGDRSIFLLFLAGSLLIRLPFFFRDYVDRDESTFILVAQSLVDGHLPYTELWDLKPPMLFLIFAVPIWLFGKSFLAIRVIGLLATSVICFYTYRIGNHIGDRMSGFAAGVTCMFLMSLFGSVQGVMSEHVSMAFLLPGIYLLVRHPHGRGYFLAGAAFALAILSKSNLAVACLLPGIYLVLRALSHRPTLRGEWGRILLLIAGGALVLLASALPYIMAGKAPLWWGSVVLAPMAYSESQEGLSLSQLTFYAGMGLLLWTGWRRRWIGREGSGSAIVLAFTAGILLAFLMGGKLNGHYLLQFYPLFLVLLFTGLRTVAPAIPRTVSGMSLLLLLVLPVESYMEYGAVAMNYARKQRLYNGEGVEVPQYLKKAYPQGGRTLFFEYHIGYWLLGTPPPSPAATHPSNICRPALFPYMESPRRNTSEELAFLLEEYRPDFIICRKGKSVFDMDYEAENATVRSYLQVYYRLDTLIGRAEVYKRL